MASTRYCRLRLPVDTAELKGRFKALWVEEHARITCLRVFK